MEEKLIQFVSENRFLFDKSNKNYKNSILRDRKFQELSETLNIPGEKLKARWRTLRDKFYKDIKRKPSGRGADSPHKKWKWLDSLMFLKDVEMENMNSQGNYVQQTPEGNDFFLSDFGESACITLQSEAFSQTPKTTPKTSGRKRKIEELIESANQDFRRVVFLADDVFMGGCEKSAIRLFFDGLGKQAEGANLTYLELSELQLQMSQSFHQFLLNRTI